jgi:MFS family permease
MAEQISHIIKDKQYFKFCLYGFLKNLRFFEPFLIIFFLQKDLSYLEIGTLYAIREVAINLFEIPSGIIADAFGRRLTLASTFLIYIISFLLFFIGEGYILFAAAMLLYALGDATRSGINKALIINYLVRTNQSDLRVDYYGHTRSWSQFGSAISSLLAGVLVFFNENLNVIFLFSIVPYIIDFFNVMSFPKYLDKHTTNLDEHTTKRINVLERTRATFILFINTLKSRRLLRTLANAAIYGGYYKSIKDFIQPFLKSAILVSPILIMYTDHERLSVILGLTYFLMFMGSAFASRNAEKIKNWVGNRTKLLNISLLFGTLLGILSGIMMTYWVYPLVIIMLFIVLLLLENLRKPSAVAEITIIGEDEVHTSVLSVMSQFTSIFTAVLVIIIGFIADKYGIGYGISAASLLMLILYPFARLKTHL